MRVPVCSVPPALPFSPPRLLLFAPHDTRAGGRNQPSTAAVTKAPDYEKEYLLRTLSLFLFLLQPSCPTGMAFFDDPATHGIMAGATACPIWSSPRPPCSTGRALPIPHTTGLTLPRQQKPWLQGARSAGRGPDRDAVCTGRKKRVRNDAACLAPQAVQPDVGILSPAPKWLVPRKIQLFLWCRCSCKLHTIFFISVKRLRIEPCGLPSYA